MGKCTKADAFAIMDAFFENGGNFIDTYVVVQPT
jgi:aryl-alcohol dehydrogenase-like predicted oxidoreductase